MGLPFSRRRPCLSHHGKLFCAHRVVLCLPQGKPPFPTDEQNSPLVSTKSGRCARSSPGYCGHPRASAPQPQTIRTSCPCASHLSDTDRCEAKDTRLGGGLFDPTTREKTAPATCVGRRSQEGWLKSLFWKERRACAHLRSPLVSICFGEASCLLGFKWCAPGPTRRLERPTQWKWPNPCVAQIITRIPLPLGLPARGKTP